ncbi:MULTISPECIES: ABC transporter permease [Chelativorans]|jgi:iron(III) transport system permease protein|uniref:Binding-protein-dependent transport systems inner membrane component n=1 Tax=Chelativorans sp. (strain BNC1) TaxID=266779 RepID=Q11K48_CHESB|nr:MULTISPECIES: ABC transporter permease subunit [Chelativorans]
MSHSVGLATAISGRRQDPLGKLVVVLAVTAVVLLLLPIAGLIMSSLVSDETKAFGLENYQSIINSRKFTTIITNTAILAVGSLAVMFLIAIPLAWLYARTDFRWRGAILIAATSQIAIPGFLVALGYIFLLNPSNGLINLWWREAGGQGSLVTVYSMPWIILLQGLTMVGPAFYFLAPAFSNVDGSIEEAASAHGVSKFEALFKILLPMTAPALISTALFFLVISVETFDYAGMLGMPARIDVVATWIYQYTQSSMTLPQYGRASAIGTMTAAVLLALILVQILVFKRSADAGTIGGRARVASVRLGKGAQLAAMTGFSIYGFLGIVLPFLMLVWTALLPVPQPPSLKAVSQLSPAGFGPQFWTELANVGGTTLFITVFVPTCVLLFTIAMSWVSKRMPALGRTIDLVTVVSLAVPSIVIAVVFNIGGLAVHRYVPIFGTVWLLAIAIGSRYVATAHRITDNAFRQLNPEMAEYARTAGVTSGRTLFSIAVPAARTGLIFAWFWVALLTLRELPITLIMSNYDLQTLASRIFLYNSSGQTQQSAALSVALFAVVTVFLAGLLYLTRRPRAR